MKTSNPTRLNLGMSATFNGKRYRLVGRAVLGVANGGTVYVWNEFNLETEHGDSATLVYEETEDGIHWRWFEMFDPQQPITVMEAAMKRPGDSAKIDGVTYFVSRADQSKVYHIEGKPPEGEKFGSQANYFNAQALGKMLVTSWTGDEIEFYRGRNLSAGMVAAGFKLPASELVKFHLASVGRFFSAVDWAAPVAIILIAGVFFIVLIQCLSSKRPPAIVKYTAPASPLAVGAMDHLGGIDYRVVSHEVAQIAEEGLSWSRHEFGLQDNLGRPALLVIGSKPKNSDWLLFTPMQPNHPLTPWTAGAVRLGGTLSLGDTTGTVTELFRESQISLEGATNSDAVQADPTCYGFIARTNHEVFLVRWSDATINFFHGHQVQPK
jgi:hypothetical protein